MTLDHFWTLTYSFLTLACSFLTLAYFPILVWNLAPSCTFSHFTVNPRWSSAPVLLPPAELPPQASSKLFPNYVHAFHSVRARAFLPSLPSFLPFLPSCLPSFPFSFLPSFLPAFVRLFCLPPLAAKEVKPEPKHRRCFWEKRDVGVEILKHADIQKTFEHYAMMCT